MQFELSVLRGPHAGAVFQFDRHDTFVAGRARTAQLCLGEDMHFSRHHFLLEFNPPHCYLRDLGSRNGTFVNGERVKELLLKNGDIISGGKTQIQFQVKAAESSSAHGSVTCLACGKTEVQIGPRQDDTDTTRFHVCTTCRDKVQSQPQPAAGFELIRQIGQGGMGTVYLAQQKSTGRAVAIKFLLPESTLSHKAIQFFLREISILSKLQHPRIVRFHEAGIAQGRFFIVMDYVDNMNLVALLESERTGTRIKTVCGIMCQVLDGLHYAHERGIVHRDIKPSNILVGRTGKKLRAKLADFGLAKSYENVGFSGLTTAGEVRGSLPYMAPEQVVNCRLARPSADIYSAGATLYFLLANRKPHRFPASRDPHSVVLDDPPVPLQERCPALPPGLPEIAHRALAKSPEERFSSAKEMRAQLLPFARGLTD
jgi:serine/threonine-protein kinase